jgi:hypothetical protein
MADGGHPNHSVACGQDQLADCLALARILSAMAVISL